MPLKYSQYYTRSGVESYHKLAISADGESLVAGDPNFGPNGEGRILKGSRTGTLSQLVTGSWSSAAEAGQDLAASGNLSSFVYETERFSSPYGFSLYAWRDGLATPTLLVTNSGNLNFTNPAISADGNTVAYHSSGQVIIKQWSGSSWQVKGSSLTNSDWFNSNAINSDGSRVALSIGQIYHWSGTDWTLVQSISGAKAVAFASASNRLAVQHTGEIRIYDYATTYSQMGDAISGQTLAAINYDGTIIATASAKIFYFLNGAWTEIPFSTSFLNPTEFSFSNDSKKTLLSSPAIFSELITVPKITEGQFFSGKVGNSFSATPSIVDGPSVYWQAFGLPTGLSINATTGLISGTPTVKGAFTVTVTPSSETTNDSWRWGIPSTLTINVADRDRLVYGPVVAQSVYAGTTEAQAVYYGPQLLWNVPGWEPPAFSPASISGLRLWLDSSVGLYDAMSGGNLVTTNSAAVRRWEDRSGNEFHATGTNSPTLSLNQVNTLPALTFNGSQYLSLPTYLNGTEASFFVVAKPSSTPSDNGPLLGNVGSASSSGHYPYQAGGIYDKTASSVRKGPITQPSGFFNWHLYNVTSADNNWRYLFNGSLHFSTTSNTYNATFGSAPTIAFDQAGGSYAFNGSIAEIIVYNTALSESDRLAVSEYLRAKFTLY